MHVLHCCCFSQRVKIQTLRKHKHVQKADNSQKDHDAILNTNTEDKVLHLKLVNMVPEQWDRKVQPENDDFRHGRGMMAIGHSTDERDAASLLEKAGFLSPSRTVFITHGFLRSSKKDSYTG